MIRAAAGIGEEEYKKLMEERKKLIPVWLHQMLQAL
jgi:hypothetical protein